MRVGPWRSLHVEELMLSNCGVGFLNCVVFVVWYFWTVVLEKTLESPLDCRRSNQSILKEISPEYSFEGLRLKLKFHYFGHLMQKTDSLEKTLMLGKIQSRRRRGQQRMRWLDGITDLMDMSLSNLWELVWWTGRPGMALRSTGSQRVGHNWVTEPKLNYGAGEDL